MENELITRKAALEAAKQGLKGFVGFPVHPKCLRRVVLGVRDNLLNVPAVNAVVIPDCLKCIYDAQIENRHKCEHCIGNPNRTNNFVSIEEVYHDPG